MEAGNPLVLIFSILLSMKTTVDSLCDRCIDKDSDGCYSDHFPCFKDCCLRGAAFCHSELRKCVLCDEKKALCGNSTLPVECLMYCYKLQHPHTNTGKCGSLNMFSLESQVSIAGAFLFGILASAVSFILWRRFKLCTRRKRKVTSQEGAINTNENSKSIDSNGDVEQNKPLLPGKESGGPPQSRQRGTSLHSSSTTSSFNDQLLVNHSDLNLRQQDKESLDQQEAVSGSTPPLDDRQENCNHVSSEPFIDGTPCGPRLLSMVENDKDLVASTQPPLPSSPQSNYPYAVSAMSPYPPPNQSEAAPGFLVHRESPAAVNSHGYTSSVYENGKLEEQAVRLVNVCPTDHDVSRDRQLALPASGDIKPTDGFRSDSNPNDSNTRE